MSGSKILLANIGNRSLVFEDGTEIEVKKNSGFRTETEKMLKDGTWELLKVNILNVLLDQQKDSIHEIHLFLSDQVGADNAAREKDTLHAGEIIKKLLVRDNNYHADKIHLITYGKSVVKPSELIPFYRDEIENIQSKLTHETLMICDSGGTPQQKTSLRLTVEYYFDWKELEFWAIDEKTDAQGLVTGGHPRKIDTVEYRKIIDGLQVIEMVKKGHYVAAKLIYQKRPDPIPKMTKALEFAHLRSHLLLKDAEDVSKEKVFQVLPMNPQPFKTIMAFKDRKLPSKFDSNWQSVIRLGDFEYATEQFVWAEFCFAQKDYTNAVLYFHAFMEQLINGWCCKLLNCSQREIGRNIKNAANLNSDLKSRMLDFLGSSSTELDVFNGIPTKLAFLNARMPTKWQDWIQSLSECHSFFNNTKGLDKLRNDIAHDGKGVKELQEINEQVALFEQNKIHKWRQWLGITGANVYEQLNEELIKAIKAS